MKKILFINPSIKETVFGKMKTLTLPPMGLGVLASRTPDKFEIAILDENVEKLNYNTNADLVAVTASTVQAPRAYKILNEFRSRGITTVIGGIHASVRTEEASNYADVVVTGEADEIWSNVLEDFDKNDLKKVYSAETRPSLENMPRIDRSIFGNKYFINSIQTSRGCPCNCSFCSVTRFNGKNYRFRPIDDVIDEMEQLKEKRFFIADDSIVGLGQEGVEHAKQLFNRMEGMGKSWGSQVCITIAEHEDLLRGAAKAGANTFYIGFESIEAESLKIMDKGINLRPMIKNYKETIKKFHDHGIGVIGGFIFGSDADTKDIFKRTIDFIHETEIDGCQFTIMTPFPGTKFYDQMHNEGRLLYTDYPNDWARYSAYEAVIKPKNMTIDELKEGQRLIYDTTSTMGRSFTRGVKTLKNTGSVINAFTNFFWNYLNYNAIRDIY